jgi:hypothetical protein
MIMIFRILKHHCGRSGHSASGLTGSGWSKPSLSARIAALKKSSGGTEIQQTDAALQAGRQRRGHVAQRLLRAVGQRREKVSEHFAFVVHTSTL